MTRGKTPIWFTDRAIIVGHVIPPIFFFTHQIFLSWQIGQLTPFTLLYTRMSSSRQPCVQNDIGNDQSMVYDCLFYCLSGRKKSSVKPLFYVFFKTF